MSDDTKKELIDWDSIKQKYDQISMQLSQSDLDPKKREELQKEASLQATLLSYYEELTTINQQIDECKKALEQEKGDLRELFQDELSGLTQQKSAIEQKIEDTLFPADERDERSAFLEIRAGTGGQEAALFVSDLFRMYSAYALLKGWTISIVSSSETDLGGYKELITHVKGKNVFKFLKFESGVHRVQRVPATETQGRVHTSTVTVAVLPEAQDVDITINPADMRIDVFRSSGPGGQSVNTTDSAVRITHIPTGIVVSCQDERSQMRNKAKAIKVLRSRLLQAEQEEKDRERSEQRKKQVGTGERAEKIRTYNFPQNRVTDHRINLTLKKLDSIMQGEIDDLIQPLVDWNRQQRRNQRQII
jgi:peptide chain release factor 1